MISHTKNSLMDLRIHWRFLSARIKQDANAASFVAQVTAFAATWNAASQKTMALEDALADAEAGAVYNDMQVDDLADEVWTAIYGTKKTASSSPLGPLFFGSSTLHEFKRPVLGTELSTALAWPGHLSQATLPALVALAPKGTTVVGGADAAAKALAKAINDLDLFTKGGELQATFDAFNALSGTVHAGLKAFALAHPELKLGSTYADSFFMHTPRSTQPTTAAAADLVAQLQHKLGVATKNHTDLLAKEKAKADAVAAHDKAVADAAAKKKAADQAKKDAAAAKKEAAKIKPKKTK